MKPIRTILIAALAATMVTGAFAQAAGPAKQQGGGKQTGQQAQGQRGPGQRMQAFAKVHEKVLAELKLTADQKKKVAALDKKRSDEMAAIRKEAEAGKRDGLRERSQKAMEAYRDGLKKVLTKDQAAKYEKRMKEEMDKLRAERGGQGGPTGQNRRPGSGGAGG